ncbi:dihydroxyacetone kinase subunit DhaL [Mycoplasma sp. E35C]|uniref:dihydroxyacetone kinase subunit DhaL n=1 Tax=Mycoplasma sp. E35C TaxID=2801918 RepID=UPI001CA458AB|nr:dihydroxyacetone kinase subunit DhaL [Mycoplasma sp. E35C]QZX48866.1 dihydroxyacetone kinase subunit L [Mycoplasma sp. E35C]
MNNVIKVFNNIAAVIIENKDYLTELDRAIGDGDHGINLARGFEKVQIELKNLDDKNIAEIFNKVAMTLISNVGGASGAIYGSAFLKAGMYLKSVEQLNNDVITMIWEEMIKAIQSRGNAKINEKTMLDVIIPAYEAYTLAIKNNDLKTAFKHAEQAAKLGVEKTKELIATKGRASYLNERSKNHIDPGAYSSYLIIKTVYESL